MPVAVRLSKLLVDRFGEEIADELVNLFNMIDATYRSELREFNEVNYARFEAKLEQRVAELRAEFRERISEVKSELIKWMFIFWASTIVPLAGLMFALQKL